MQNPPPDPRRPRARIDRAGPLLFAAGCAWLAFNAHHAWAQDDIEREFWKSVNCESEAEVQAYLSTYPEGAYKDQALGCLGGAAPQTDAGAASEDRMQGSVPLPRGVSVDAGLAVVRWVAFHRITGFNESHKSGGFLDLQLSGDGSRVAFATARGVWIVNADGTDLKQLSEQHAGHGGVDISIDGSVVAWNDSQGLFVYDVAGGERRSMPPGIAVWSLRLSGDGRWLFAWDYDTGSLFRMPADGSDIRKVMTNDPLGELSGHGPNRNLWGTMDEGPSVSRDGSRVALEYGGEAFVMNGDGTGLRMLTANGANDIEYLDQVKLSPDGGRVSWYLPENDDRMVIADTDGNILGEHTGVQHVHRTELTADGQWLAASSGLRLLSADGAQRLNLTHVGHNYPMAVRGAKLASISDDGRRAAFVVQAQFGDVSGHEQVMVADLDPTSLDGVSALGELRVTPRFLPNDGATRAVLTVRAADEAPLDRVMAFLMKNGYQGANDEYSAIPLADDGAKYGDAAAGDGVFTTNELRLNPRGGEPVPPGPLVLRVFAVNETGNMMLIDVAGLESRAP